MGLTTGLSHDQSTPRWVATCLSLPYLQLLLVNLLFGKCSGAEDCCQSVPHLHTQVSQILIKCLLRMNQRTAYTTAQSGFLPRKRPRGLLNIDPIRTLLRGALEWGALRARCLRTCAARPFPSPAFSILLASLLASFSTSRLAKCCSLLMGRKVSGRCFWVTEGVAGSGFLLIQPTHIIAERTDTFKWHLQATQVHN